MRNPGEGFLLVFKEKPRGDFVGVMISEGGWATLPSSEWGVLSRAVLGGSLLEQAAGEVEPNPCASGLLESADPIVSSSSRGGKEDTF